MKDSDYLETDTVQFWVRGSMMTAQMKLNNARELVDEGKAFVISCQAIGAITDGKKDS